MFNTSNSVLFCLSVSFIVILNLSRAHNKLEDRCCNRRGNIFFLFPNVMKHFAMKDIIAMKINFQKLASLIRKK